ncbi:hypothetical protein CC99x_007075 [Candidatus Berkiella cookevillensis]|uniref:Uncharacterized protein n=1 Tax=Candidatus Berkiella cookevillensis TaxID=437022 RepID=A0A0Q9YLS1_9GAMM|nr:hypothetical protein [Candidatus Berkiella cookevillensis]MCS5708668.1 hypothetical protein [Candidatus Berkiella cookevillensis]
MLGLKKLLERKQEKNDSSSLQYELESLQARESDEKKDAPVIDEAKVSPLTLSFSYDSFKPKSSPPIPIRTPRKRTLQQPEPELEAEISSSLPMWGPVKSNKEEWCSTSYQLHETSVKSVENFDEFYVGSPQGEERERYLKNFFKK